MKTIAIPQFYCGPSGQKGLYNRQEVGLARAFAALGCRAVVLYPAPGAAAPTVENPEPNVKIYYLPVRKFRRAGVLFQLAGAAGRAGRCGPRHGR